MKKFIALLVAIATLGSALTSSAQIQKRIEERTGHTLNPSPKPEAFALPEGVSLADGLTESEAAAIALWNNAAFQSDLTALGFARADLVEAGQLRNPILSLLFPWGPKQLEATVSLPLEVFWQRPRRVAAAKLDYERVAESLVQTGLNLIRDVKIAYADLALAIDRARTATEMWRQQTEIARIVEARLRAGDISELETNASRIDQRMAEEQAARFTREAAMARDRLRAMLGMQLGDPSFEITPTVRATDAAWLASVSISNADPSTDEIDKLIRQALAARPDVRAAEIAIESAGKRAGWERSKILSIAATIDANGSGKKGFEIGPGLQAELPIFNRNQGGIKRAEAEILRAARQYAVVRQRVAFEVQESLAQLIEARQSLASWQSSIIRTIEEDTRLAERAYQSGEVSYLFVLETSRRLNDARLREAESLAALRRASAQLERAMGGKFFEKQ
jgi:cobalt-zinc-cadmium efflux system outer membrane protein